MITRARGFFRPLFRIETQLWRSPLTALYPADERRGWLLPDPPRIIEHLRPNRDLGHEDERLRLEQERLLRGAMALLITHPDYMLER